MWNCNKKNFICFLLAVSILLSGMCYEKVQADFLLMEKNQTEMADVWDNTMMESPLPGFVNMSGQIFQNKGNASKMEIPEGKLFSPEVRTEEVVNRSTVVDFVKSIGKLRQKPGSALLHSFLLNNKTEIFLYYSHLERNPRTYSNTVIVQYIHEKDGKKASVHMIG